MSRKYFPLDNNKDLSYPINTEKEGLYPVWAGFDFFALRGYDSSNSQVASSNWGSSSTDDSLWIGKDVDFVELIPNPCNSSAYLESDSDLDCMVGATSF